MRDQVGHNELENLDEDQIMQEDDIKYSSVRDTSRSPEKEIRERKEKMKQSLEEEQDLLGA